MEILKSFYFWVGYGVILHFRYIKCNSKSVQVDMGELGRALCSFDESIPYLTTIKDELAVKVSAISSESSNIDEVSDRHVDFMCFSLIIEALPIFCSFS